MPNSKGDSDVHASANRDCSTDGSPSPRCKCRSLDRAVSKSSRRPRRLRWMECQLLPISSPSFDGSRSPKQAEDGRHSSLILTRPIPIRHADGCGCRCSDDFIRAAIAARRVSRRSASPPPLKSPQARKIFSVTVIASAGGGLLTASDRGPCYPVG